jgi:hypothetical protein
MGAATKEWRAKMNEVSMENSSTPSVSDAWKAKFDVLQKIGADKQFIYYYFVKLIPKRLS